MKVVDDSTMSVKEANTYEAPGLPHLGCMSPSPRLTFACFRARGVAALADKPKRRRVMANKLSLYIFRESGW